MRCVCVCVCVCVCSMYLKYECVALWCVDSVWVFGVWTVCVCLVCGQCVCGEWTECVCVVSVCEQCPRVNQTRLIQPAALSIAVVHLRGVCL